MKDSLDILRTDYVEDDTIEHHGILGMKWGIRRYQNKDGSLTKDGQKRYNKAEKLIEKNMDRGYNVAEKRAEKEKKRSGEIGVKMLNASDAAKKLKINDKETINYIEKRDKLMPLGLKYSSGKTKEEKVLNFYNDERNMYKLEHNMRQGAIERYKGSKGLMGVGIKLNEKYAPFSQKIADDGYKIRTEQMEHLRKEIESNGNTINSKPSYRSNGNISWMGEELYVVPKKKEVK